MSNQSRARPQSGAPADARHPHRSARERARSPYVISTRELGRRPGSMQTLQLTVPAPVPMALEMIRVPEGSDVDLALRLEAVSEGVMVSGEAAVALTGECSRCLEPFTDQLTVDLQELFAYPGSTTVETASEEEQIEEVVDDTVDLEPVLRDAVVLALDPNPLHDPDCLGLCPQCGLPLADLPADHAHESLDPRWAKLQALLPEQGRERD